MWDKRRKYTPEFRAQAAKLVTETGRPIAHVAAEIGVGGQFPGHWLQQATRARAGDADRPLDVSERAELEQLRSENADLRFDRSFLKKATVFFASDQNQ